MQQKPFFFFALNFSRLKLNVNASSAKTTHLFLVCSFISPRVNVLWAYRYTYFARGIHTGICANSCVWKKLKLHHQAPYNVAPKKTERFQIFIGARAITTTIDDRYVGQTGWGWNSYGTMIECRVERRGQTPDDDNYCANNNIRRLLIPSRINKSLIYVWMRLVIALLWLMTIGRIIVDNELDGRMRFNRRALQREKGK